MWSEAVNCLTTWQANSPEQFLLRDEFLMFLRDHPAGLTRECRPGHLTASTLVMDDRRQRVLLTLHPKVGRWLQLGGHLESGDTSLRTAALREAREESGIEVIEMSLDPVRLDTHPVRCGADMSIHLDVQFLGLVAADAQEKISGESDDLRWFDLESLPTGLDPSVCDLIEDSRRKVIHKPARTVPHGNAK